MAPTSPPNAPSAVAAFDLDGTLTEGGSVVAWLSAVAGGDHVRSAILRHSPSLVVGAIRSGPTADAAKERLFTAVLAGQEATRVTSVSAAFAAEHLNGHVRRPVAERLAAHLDAGHLVVVVSASPSLYVTRIAESLGAHGAVGTDLAVNEHGELTGHYEGANCRGAEKLRKVRELLVALGAGTQGAAPLFAYGNSRGDLRLLSGADYPVDVSRLGRLGALRRFPRLGDVAVSPGATP
jgi:phosphatidylglycerophosphatase C